MLSFNQSANLLIQIRSEYNLEILQLQASERLTKNQKMRDVLCIPCWHEIETNI